MNKDTQHDKFVLKKTESASYRAAKISALLDDFSDDIYVSTQQIRLFVIKILQSFVKLCLFGALSYLSLNFYTRSNVLDLDINFAESIFNNNSLRFFLFLIFVISVVLFYLNTYSCFVNYRNAKLMSKKLSFLREKFKKITTLASEFLDYTDSLSEIDKLNLQLRFERAEQIYFFSDKSLFSLERLFLE